MHSCVYIGLLVVWLVPGLAAEAVLGLTHGIGWILMSIACIVALALRVIDLRLATAVAILGGIGPFIGSYEFIRQDRARSRPGATRATEPGARVVESDGNRRYDDPGRHAPDGGVGVRGHRARVAQGRGG